MTLSQTAELVVALGTVAALALGVIQLRANFRLNSENFSRNAWSEYLKLGLQYPELGESRIAIRHFKLESPEELVSGETMGSQRYLWFLTVVMDACENICIHLAKERWEATIMSQLSYHKEALKAVWYVGDDPWSRYYTAALDRLVSKVLNDA